jgi:hypothetical protein
MGVAVAAGMKRGPGPVWIARACVRDCRRAPLLSFCMHTCGTRACARAGVRAGDGRHVGLEVSATRVPITRLGTRRRLSPPPTLTLCALHRAWPGHCNDLARKTMGELQEEAAAPPQIPGGAAPAPAPAAHHRPRPTTPPAVQSLPVKSTSSMDGVAARHRSARHGRACTCVRACLHLRQHRSVPPCARADSVHVH